MTPRQQKRLDEIKGYMPQVVGITARAFERKSPLAAIKAKCCDCVGWEDARKRISECTTEDCPLWRYRPFVDDIAKKTLSDSERQALKARLAAGRQRKAENQ